MRESPKVFGTSVGTVCCLVATIQFWRGRPIWAIGFGSVGVFLIAAALVAPAVLWAPSRVWWRLARTLAWVNTRIVLSLLYFLVFTPLAIVFRLMGRDSLKRRWQRGTSGWTRSPDRLHQATHFDHMY